MTVVAACVHYSLSFPVNVSRAHDKVTVTAESGRNGATTLSRMNFSG